MHRRVSSTVSLWGPLLSGLVVASAGCNRPSAATAERGVAIGRGVTSSSPPAPPGDREGSAGSAGWPGLFGPDHNGVSRETNVLAQWPDAGPPVRWSRPLGTGYAAPVVGSGMLVLFYRDGDVEVIEGARADSGRTRWTFRYPTAYRARVNYSDGPYSTPALDRDHVYAWGAEGRLHCLDLHRGVPCWSRSLNAEYQVEPGMFPVSSSPLLDGDRLIVNVGGRPSTAGIVALNKHTGDTLWTATADGASCATPAAATLHGRRFVFVWTYEHLVALDPASGRVWWQIPFRAHHPDTINASSPVVCGDLVLVSGYQVGSLCVRVRSDGSYQELWRGHKQVLDSHYNNLVCRDGYVYGFGTIGGGLRCVQMETGRLMWRWKSRLRNAASIAVGDRLILFDERGRLASVAVSPRGCQPVSQTTAGLLAGRCFSAPALSGGLLYLRNEEELRCLDLRPTAADPAGQDVRLAKRDGG